MRYSQSLNTVSDDYIMTKNFVRTASWGRDESHTRGHFGSVVLSECISWVLDILDRYQSWGLDILDRCQSWVLDILDRYQS